MPWNDVLDIESQLTSALETFDWSGAAAICDDLIRRIHAEPEPLPEDTAKRLLQSLRRKRRFQLITLLGEALIYSGQRAPQIRRQYAQALIDQGILTAPELVLQALIQDSQGAKSEEREARGLMGRIYKQIYVNISDSRSPRHHAYLERALNEYLYVYRLAPQENLWHGINVVALLERARRDHLSLQGLPDPSALARDILATVQAREVKDGELTAWDVATAMEAELALGRHAEAEGLALRYAARKEADAFEIASTIRQLTEVWQLNDVEPPGSRLLPICRAALLGREGFSMEMDPQSVRGEIVHVDEAHADLEEAFGPDRTWILTWYKEGLKRCESIARIEGLDGRAYGTGWLIDAADFFPEQEGRVLLLTNAHVVSPTPFPTALLPEQARAHFQVLGKIFEVEEVVWSSPPGELDVTFLSLKGERPAAEPLAIETDLVRIKDAPRRLYMIGHPGGPHPNFSLKAGAPDPKFSLQDTCLLASDERFLRYRTPTDGGSSGSPMFEPDGWRVVALHRAGTSSTEQLDTGTYTNEGVSIRAIQQATRERSAAGYGPAVRRRAEEVSLPEKLPRARFYFALEGEAARGIFVRYGTDVDLIFNYAPPPADAAAVLSASDLDRVRESQSPLGIMVAPIGLTFRGQSDSGYRQMHFYQGGTVSDEVRFELHAMDDPMPGQPVEGSLAAEDLIAPPTSGLHVIFDIRGCMLYQFFLPVQLVRTLPELEDGVQAAPLTFDLDQLRQFDEHAAEAQMRMAAALREVLS